MYINILILCQTLPAAAVALWLTSWQPYTEPNANAYQQVHQGNGYARLSSSLQGYKFTFFHQPQNPQVTVIGDVVVASFNLREISCYAF